jgi:diphosphomevalonate decarboxylase
MRASAIAHPNIALIKYWGKRHSADNLPAVGSLSVTLGAMTTETSVEIDSALDHDVLVLNGEEIAAERTRLSACMDALRKLADERRHVLVKSRNDFPTGAGLASSASGYAALVTAAAAAVGLDAHDPRLPEIARIGSGSAPRSMFGGIVMLKNDDHGTLCEQVFGPEVWPLSVVVAVISDDQKAVSSRSGMESSRRTSVFYDTWVETHADDLQNALSAVVQKDFASLAELAEYNCLKMHSVMMTSRPSLIYWLPETLACLRRIVDLRGAGMPVFFTIDAGPQVKAVCLPAVTSAVENALREIPGVRRTIKSALGEGARLKSQ